jgi:hypothetical protein
LPWFFHTFKGEAASTCTTMRKALGKDEEDNGDAGQQKSLYF